MIMLLHLTRVDDVMCFKHTSFLFLVQKKMLEVNVGEKWNLLSIIVNIGKSRQYCLNENVNDSLFIIWDKRERVFFMCYLIFVLTRNFISCWHLLLLHTEKHMIWNVMIDFSPISRHNRKSFWTPGVSDIFNESSDCFQVQEL